MCLVFKTTYIDRERPLPEGAFFFTRTMLFPPLDKRNTRDKAKGLRTSSERYIGGLGVQCLSTLNKIAGSTLRQQSCLRVSSSEPLCCELQFVEKFPFR